MGSQCLHVPVNSASGNVLVPSGNNPFTEPLLTQIYIAILNSDLLHGTMYHPTKFHADSWIILVVDALPNCPAYTEIAQ